MLVLVTGGARSGKSRYAESILRELEGDKLYIATAIPFDDEMKERIKKHQSVRPDDWTTYEGYTNLDQVIQEKGANSSAILLDCVTLWITNLLFDLLGDQEMDSFSQGEIDEIERHIQEVFERFVEEAHKIQGTVVLVTNEIGLGIVPESKLSRVFRDLQGRMNQLLGKAADRVILVICGCPLQIK